MKRMRRAAILLLLAVAPWTAAGQDPVQNAFAKLDAAVKANDRAKFEAAFQELQSMGPKVLPACEQRLEAGTDVQQGMTLRVLFGLGPAAAPALPAVVAVAENPKEHEGVRGEAASALARIDASPETVRRLAVLLKDKSRVVRWNTAEGLAFLGPAAEPALSALADACAVYDEDVSGYACAALGDIRARPDVCVPALIKALGGLAGGPAAGALAKFKRDARPAVPTLVRLVNDAAAARNTLQGHVMAVALGQIGGPEAREALPALEQLHGMMDAVNTKEDLADVIYKIKAIKPAPGAAPEKTPAPAPATAPAPAAPIDAAPAPAAVPAGSRPLPPDGGEAGKAYLALCQAIRRNDPEALRALGMTDEMKLTPAQAQMMIKGLTAAWPANPTIVRGFALGDGERAVLHVTGVREKTTLYGTVAMEKRAGGWVVVSTTWDDKPPR